MDEILPDHCAKEVVVLCCGNILFGDDGFGPAVADRINASETVPEWAAQHTSRGLINQWC